MTKKTWAETYPAMAARRKKERSGEISARDPLTDEEDAEIQRMIVSDPDNPEWTEEMFAKAKPFAEVFPELAAKMRKLSEAKK